jgi:IstB-like ATP binding protein
VSNTGQGVQLNNQLEQKKAAGRTSRLAEKLLRYDLIVTDELGYLPFSQPGGPVAVPPDQQTARKSVVADHD